jgi:hypothetical protein
MCTQSKPVERELQKIEVRRSHRQHTLAKLAEMIEAARAQASTAAEELAAMQRLEQMILLADVRDLARRNALLASDAADAGRDFTPPPPAAAMDAPQIAQLNDDCDLADARLDEAAQTHPPDDVVPLAPDVADVVFDERHEPVRWHDDERRSR